MGNSFLGCTKRNAMSRAKKGGLLLCFLCSGPTGSALCTEHQLPLSDDRSKGQGSGGGGEQDGGDTESHITAVMVRTAAAPEGLSSTEHPALLSPSILGVRCVRLPSCPFYRGASEARHGGVTRPSLHSELQKGKVGAWVPWTPEVILVMSAKPWVPLGAWAWTVACVLVDGQHPAPPGEEKL